MAEQPLARGDRVTFPGSDFGGPAGIKTLCAPFHEMRFCVTGALGDDNAETYVAYLRNLCGRVMDGFRRVGRNARLEGANSIRPSSPLIPGPSLRLISAKLLRLRLSR
jgi:hypothetical protein